MVGEAQDQNWPLPQFCFIVQFRSLESPVSFQEISGLETEAQAVEYRHGDSKVFSTVKMPGIDKTRNVTLKRGVFVNNQHFRNWVGAIGMNTLKRETVIIQLVDERAIPTMTWTLTNAWITKITASDLRSDGNEVAVETMELAHEGITIFNG